MQQLTLLAEFALVISVSYYPDFLSLEQANELYQYCLKLEWPQNQIRMLGKTMPRHTRSSCLYSNSPSSQQFFLESHLNTSSYCSGLR